MQILNHAWGIGLDPYSVIPYTSEALKTLEESQAMQPSHILPIFQKSGKKWLGGVSRHRGDLRGLVADVGLRGVGHSRASH